MKKIKVNKKQTKSTVTAFLAISTISQIVLETISPLQLKHQILLIESVLNALKYSEREGIDEKT